MDQGNSLRLSIEFAVNTTDEAVLHRVKFNVSETKVSEGLATIARRDSYRHDTGPDDQQVAAGCRDPLVGYVGSFSQPTFQGGPSQVVFRTKVVRSFVPFPSPKEITMKALATSLAVAALLCVSVMIQSVLADYTSWCCGGPYDGCPYTGPQCQDSSGRCPNNGPMYGATVDVTVSVWSCVPKQSTGCSDNYTSHFCLVNAFVNQNNGTCGTPACQFFQDVPQCQNNMCPNN